MNRTELAQELARQAQLSLDAARRAVDGLFGNSRELGVIATALRDGQRVQLPGFGTFEGRARPARQGLDPRTRRPLLIPAARVPGFRAGSALRTALRTAAGGLRQAPEGLAARPGPVPSGEPGRGDGAGSGGASSSG